MSALSMRTAIHYVLLLATTAIADTVTISVDAGQSLGSFTPINRFFGCDEPNFADYPYGEALLSELGSLGPAQTYFRTHNLLTTGDGNTTGVPSLKFGSTNAYTEDAQGNPIYNWTIVDNIFDSYLSRNVKPYLQVGFMPLVLSSHPDPYFFDFEPTSPYYVIYTGWSYPPTSYQKWGEIAYQWTKHNVERYGQAEVESWYFEIWNEPNIQYWNGTQDEFFKLHDYAVDGVRRALPSARVGGCEVAGGAAGGYLDAFLNHSLAGPNYATGANSTPLDFISFHSKGAPLFINTTNTTGYVQMNVSTQLKQADEAFGVIASHPPLQNTPIVMGEYDPDGCAACVTPQYGYRNGLLYPAYTAAAFVRAMDLSARRGVNLEGALTWAFEYEKTATLDETAFFDGFRVLTTQGIDKPVLNVHRMLGKMTGDRINATSSGQVPLDTVLADSVRNASDVGVLASLELKTEKLYVFVWHYHDNDLDFPDAQVELDVSGVPWEGNTNLTHYRLDEEHSNSYSKWLSMGSPQPPTEDQYAELAAAGKLMTLEEPHVVGIDCGKVDIGFSLPIRALSLLVLEKC